MEVLAAAVDQQANVERQQGSGGSPAPGGGTAATAAAKTRAAVQAEVHQEHAARIATETDGSLVTWTEEVHEQVTAADAAFLAARDAHQKVGGWVADCWGCRPCCHRRRTPHSCDQPQLCGAAGRYSVYPMQPPQSNARQCPTRTACLPPCHPPRRTLRALRRERPTEQTSAARARALSGTPVWRKRSRWGDGGRH